MADTTKSIGELRQRLREGTLIVVVGAGASIGATRSAPTASWQGLLLDGVSHCREFGNPCLKEEEEGKCRALLDNAGNDLFLAAASIVESRLKAPDGVEWARWIREAIGKLKFLDYDLADAIHRLGAPIVTTNYDNGLLGPRGEEPFAAITWKDPARVVEVLLKRERGVVHLHGHWTDPRSIVLGPKSYERLLAGGTSPQIEEAVARFNTMLFVGYGGGIADPNLGRLVERFSSPGAPMHRHYILLRSPEAREFKPTSALFPLDYGGSYELLPHFLDSLRDRGPSGARAVRRDSVAVAPEGKEFIEADGVPVPRMVIVPAGSFLMGGDGSDAFPDELPRHKVTIPSRFAVAVTPITFDEWDAFEDSVRGHHRPRDNGWGRGRHPVIHVTWEDTREYLDWLNSLESIEGSYRLLSEAEWEYVARAGSTTHFWWGGEPDPARANFDRSGLGRTTVVGSYGRNPFGVYDVLGNVWEWVEDRYHSSYDKARSDGSAWIEGDDSRRVVRGGCWYYDDRYLRCSARLPIEPHVRFSGIGFRVARTIRQELVIGETYVLLSANSGLAVTLREDRVINQSRWEEKPGQIWKVVTGPKGGVRLQCVANGEYLAVSPPVDRNMSRITTLPGGPVSPEWTADPERDGYVFQYQESGKVLDVDGIATAEGALLIQFSRHGNANQRWWLRPVVPPK